MRLVRIAYKDLTSHRLDSFVCKDWQYSGIMQLLLLKLENVQSPIHVCHKKGVQLDLANIPIAPLLGLDREMALFITHSPRNLYTMYATLKTACENGEWIYYYDAQAEKHLAINYFQSSYMTQLGNELAFYYHE